MEVELNWSSLTNKSLSPRTLPVHSTNERTEPIRKTMPRGMVTLKVMLGALAENKAMDGAGVGRDRRKFVVCRAEGE